MMIEEKKVPVQQGGTVAIQADTVCIHGDGPHALAFAQGIHKSLPLQAIKVASIS